MVGFKSIILLFTLLLFGACVPQTKQTECRSNEAFNASLRTCVPVVNGPSSFINISNFLPSGPLVKYHNDGTQVTFSVVVDNPYAQAYTIQWERIYNGITYSISPTTPTSYSVAPVLYTGQLGTHVFSVKIKDSTNQVVDSHNFELVLNASPKPVIVSTSVTPAAYNVSYTPNQGAQTFSFNVYNNNASMIGAGYQVDWSLTKNGVEINTDTDAFPTTSPAGSLSTTGYNYPRYIFTPSSSGLGSYTLRGRVTNSAAEVVAEQQWAMVVQHPPLQAITARPIYASNTGPAATATTVAYDSVPYTSYTAYNFRPTTSNTGQADYCVWVASGTGSYPSDAYFVRVDWYLDGTTLLYSNWTTAVDNKVCLTDGGAAILAGLVFTNTAVPHSLVARVFDEGTGSEYTSTNMSAGLGTYPITWPITLKAQNEAPSVAFMTDTVITGCSTSGNARTACAVTSDTNFKVKINLTNDDFYFSPFVEANFDYSIRLYENGLLIQSCTKAGYLNADPNLVAAADTNGTDGYECELRINSYNTVDTINTAAYQYTIQAEVFDNGSPITTTDATSATLTWTFPVGNVSETETPPSIASWAVSPSATEGVTNGITFSASITDAERDDHLYEVQYETSSGNWITLTSGTIYRTTNTNPHSFSISYTLPESFLISPAITTCPASSGIRTTGNCSVPFRLKLTDVIYTAPTAGTTTSGSQNSTIFNTNPAPSLNLTAPFTVPAPVAWTATAPTAFVGFPITFSIASTFATDTSVPTAEKTFRYQWYAKNASTYVGSWQVIPGATSQNFIWTPSVASVALDRNIDLMLCVDDQPAAAVPTPNTTYSVCTNGTPWSLTSYNNVARAYDLSTLTSPTTMAVTSSTTSDPGNETAIWYETPSTFNSVTSSAAYVASIGNDKKIYVKKVLARSNGQLDTTSSSHIVAFDALEAPAVINTVKDLSIVGDGDELYIAYLASRNTAPASLYPQVRRIDLTASGSKVAPNVHAGMLGFDYDGLTVSNGCTPSPGDCVITYNTTNVDITFSPSTPSMSGSLTFVTPWGSQAISLGVYNGLNQIDGNDPTAMATQLATIINTSVYPALAGLTASSSGSSVTITGSLADDFFDADLVAAERMADQLGQIYISGGNWYLPFINNSLGGGDNDKISYYTGATNGLMNAAAVTVVEPPVNTFMSAIGQVSKISTHFDGTKLWIAAISKVGSQGRLYKVDPVSFNYTAGTEDEPVLTPTALIDIQLSVSSSRAFVGAKVLAGDLMIQVFDNNVDPYPSAAASYFEIDTPANVEASTDTLDYFNPTSIASWKIIAYGTEARILAASKGPLPDTTYDLYLARLKLVSSTWTISCGDCAQISELETNNSVSPYVKINAAPIRTAAGALYRMASDGFNNSGPYDGIRDVAFISYGRLNGATACDPAMGVINVQAESIYTDTLFTGTGPIDVGLSRPPIIK